MKHYFRKKFYFLNPDDDHDFIPREKRFDLTGRYCFDIFLQSTCSIPVDNITLAPVVIPKVVVKMMDIILNRIITHEDPAFPNHAAIINDMEDYGFPWNYEKGRPILNFIESKDILGALTDAYNFIEKYLKDYPDATFYYVVEEQTNEGFIIDRNF